ncbi:MAG: hypothetical protein WCT12_28760 [Verrucomicrobiota bacterium]
MKNGKSLSAFLVAALLLSCEHRTSAQDAGGLSAKVHEAQTALQQVQTDVETKLVQVSNAEQPEPALKDLAGIFYTKSNRCAEIAQDVVELARITNKHRDGLNSNQDLPSGTRKELLGVLESQLQVLDEFGNRIREIKLSLNYLDAKRKQWLASYTSIRDISGEDAARKALRDDMERARAEWLKDPRQENPPRPPPASASQRSGSSHPASAPGAVPWKASLDLQASWKQVAAFAKELTNAAPLEDVSSVRKFDEHLSAGDLLAHARAEKKAAAYCMSKALNAPNEYCKRYAQLAADYLTQLAELMEANAAYKGAAGSKDSVTSAEERCQKARKAFLTLDESLDLARQAYLRE